MYCRHCGNFMQPNAAFCIKCGINMGAGNRYCYNCGAVTDPKAVVCVRCGVSLSQHPVSSSEQKSMLVAGLLGIFVGWLGIHSFYLGYTAKGIVQLLLSIISFGTIGDLWGFIEGVLILCNVIKNDANGIPLK